jgi:hypothetical protein
MAYSITQFENNLTNSLVALDANFTTFGALVPIPCTISGINTLTLTQNAVGLVPTPTIQGYSTGMLFTGIAAASNSGPVQAQVGSLGLLNVYTDTILGPALLIFNEIIANCAISLLYDAALNSGAGGFHLIATSAINNANVFFGNIVASGIVNAAQLQVGSGGTLTNLYSGNSPTLTFSATPGWSSQDQTFSVTATLAALLPAIGDFVQVNPPSLGAAGIDYRGYVTGVGSISSVASAATINIRLINGASASLASNSGVYRYLATRSAP